MSPRTYPAPINTAVNTAGYFDAIFSAARRDALLILNERGEVQRANTAFTAAFGYTEKDIYGRHMRVLFSEADQLLARPEEELREARTTGSANDDVYLMHKNGTALWVTGELYHVQGEIGPGRFIKLIHNISALKILDKFVFEPEELMDIAFRSGCEGALVLLDTRLNILRSNKGFSRMFGPIDEEDGPARLTQLSHPFWKSEVVRHRLRELVVLDKPLNEEAFGVVKTNGQELVLKIRSKTMEADGAKQILLMIQE